MAIFNFFRLESTKVKWVISANNGTISQEVEWSKIGVYIYIELQVHYTPVQYQVGGVYQTFRLTNDVAKTIDLFFRCAKNEPHEFGIRIKLLCWLSFPILPCFRGDLRTLFPTTTIISPHKKEGKKTRLYENNFFHKLYACH